MNRKIFITFSIIDMGYDAHVDAGYDIAIEAAKRHGIKMPMLK